MTTTADRIDLGENQGCQELQARSLSPSLQERTERSGVSRLGQSDRLCRRLHRFACSRRPGISNGSVIGCLDLDARQFFPEQIHFAEDMSRPPPTCEKSCERENLRWVLGRQVSTPHEENLSFVIAVEIELPAFTRRLLLHSKAIGINT